jgi:hypothetical protein
MFTIIGADQAHYGPVTAEEIRQWIRDRRADGNTMARADGSTEWKPLAAFSEFADLTAAAGAPPRLSASSPAPLGHAAAPVFTTHGDFEIGRCFSQAWALLANNFSLLVGAASVVWFLDEIADIIPFAGLFLGGVLYGGLYLVYLRRIRGETTSVGEAFAGFGNPFIQLLLAGFLTTLLAGIGYLFCMLPWVYLKIAWIFTLVLVIDRRMEFWTAMELSRKVATRVWFKVFALASLAFAPTILFKGFVLLKTVGMMYSTMYPLFDHGLPDFAKLMPLMKHVAEETATINMVAQLVLLINLPFGAAALMYAYEALFGPRPAPAP